MSTVTVTRPRAGGTRNTPIRHLYRKNWRETGQAACGAPYEGSHWRGGYDGWVDPNLCVVCREIFEKLEAGK